MVLEKSSRNESEEIVRMLNAYNLNEVSPSISLESPYFNFHIQVNNRVVAGIISYLGYWGALEIQTLVVADDHRRMGLGTRLLKEAELGAKMQGATLSLVDTFNFQNPAFYEKNGYQSFGQLQDFPRKGDTRFYYSKSLV